MVPFHGDIRSFSRRLVFLLSTSVAAQQEAPHNIGQLTESLRGIRPSDLDFGREGRVGEQVFEPPNIL